MQETALWVDPGGQNCKHSTMRSFAKTFFIVGIAGCCLVQVESLGLPIESEHGERALKNEDKNGDGCSVDGIDSFMYLLYALVGFVTIFIHTVRGGCTFSCAYTSLCGWRTKAESDGAHQPVTDSSSMRFAILLLYIIPVIALAYLLNGMDKDGFGGDLGDIAELVNMCASPLIDLYLALRFYYHFSGSEMHGTVLEVHRHLPQDHMHALKTGLRLAKGAKDVETPTHEKNMIEFSQMNRETIRTASCVDRTVLWWFGIFFALPLSLLADFVRWSGHVPNENTFAVVLKFTSLSYLVYTPEFVATKVFERYIYTSCFSILRRPLCTPCYLLCGWCFCDPDCNVQHSYRYFSTLSYVFGGVGLVCGLVCGLVAAILTTTSCQLLDPDVLMLIVFGAIIGCSLGCYSALYNGSRYDVPRATKSDVCLASCGAGGHILLSYSVLPAAAPGLVGSILGVEHGHQNIGYLMLPVKDSKILVDSLMKGLDDDVEGEVEMKHQSADEEGSPISYKENPMKAFHGNHEPVGPAPVPHEQHHEPAEPPPDLDSNQAHFHHEQHHEPAGPPPPMLSHEESELPQHSVYVDYSELPHRTELVQSPSSDHAQNGTWGEDGHWYIWDNASQQYYDSGYTA